MMFLDLYIKNKGITGINVIAVYQISAYYQMWDDIKMDNIPFSSLNMLINTNDDQIENYTYKKFI